MVAHDDREVKKNPLFRRCLSWIDRHPRVGWYLCIVATCNLLLNLIEVFH